MMYLLSLLYISIVSAQSNIYICSIHLFSSCLKGVFVENHADSLTITLKRWSLLSHLHSVTRESQLLCASRTRRRKEGWRPAWLCLPQTSTLSENRVPKGFLKGSNSTKGLYNENLFFERLRKKE